VGCTNFVRLYQGNFPRHVSTLPFLDTLFSCKDCNKSLKGITQEGSSFDSVSERVISLSLPSPLLPNQVSSTPLRPCKFLPCVCLLPHKSIERRRDVDIVTFFGSLFLRPTLVIYSGGRLLSFPVTRSSRKKLVRLMSPLFETPDRPPIGAPSIGSPPLPSSPTFSYPVRYTSGFLLR